MTRTTFMLALFSLGACSQRDVSKSMQRSAMHAAFQAQLDEAERDARVDGFWNGVAPMADVMFAGEEPPLPSSPTEAATTPAEPNDVPESDPQAEQAPALPDEPVVVEPEPLSDLVEAEPVSPAEEALAVDVADAVVDEPAVEPPVEPGDVAVEVLEPPPTTDGLQTLLVEAPADPGLSNPPEVMGVPRSERMLRAGASMDASPELVRALDDLRWTMTLEARLADKQRVIDAMGARLDGRVAVAAGMDPAVLEQLDRLAAAQQSVVERMDQQDAEAAERSAVEADRAAIVEAEAAEALAAEKVADEEAAAAAELEKQDLDRRMTEIEAAQTSTLQALQALTARLETTETLPPTPASETNEEWLAMRSDLAEERAETARSNTEVLAAVSDLRAQVSAISLRQQKAETRAARREFRLFRRKQRAEADVPEPVAVQPVVVQSTTEETERLRAQLVEAEDARVRAEAKAADDLSALEARLAAFEADRARMEALQAELATDSGDAERLAQVEEAMSALEGDRAKLGDLQDQVSGLVEERARLEAELAEADDARRAELLAEREAYEARTAELNQELVALRERQLEMEQKYTNRQEAVLARLQPLIDSGLDVRLVDGDIRVDLASDVLFASGSAALQKVGAENLRAVATALEPFPTLKVQVQGHTDNVPVRSARFKSNWDLAFARASAVHRVLLDSGLPAARTSAASFGDTRPVSDNDTPAGRAKNRRIELRLELPPVEETP